MSARPLALLLVMGLAACTIPARLAEVGRAPDLAPIENPTLRPGYRPVSLPMPDPEPRVSAGVNSLWREGARGFFRDQRARRVGDVLTVNVTIQDRAVLANQSSRSRKNADGPLSAARGNYWLARAHEALGSTSEANRYYEEAAQRIDTFHGALARQKLSPGPQGVPIPLPAMPSASVVEAFSSNPMLRAAMLAHHAGVERGITRTIVAHLRNRLASEAEVALLAHLASSLGDNQMALRVGKTGVARNMNLFAYAYPVHPFPDYKPLRKSPERALLLAIARQESEFNPEIISHAGARGLLQVMPITARHICRDYKIKCDIPRLTTDTSYNAMISSAYVADRKEEFSGSYVLTLAGYNAGPGRARQWMKRFGDPRKEGVDPIDWIEMIPFEETRDYVKKVLSNVQMYRARLGDPTPVRLVSDLKR